MQGQQIPPSGKSNRREKEGSEKKNRNTRNNEFYT
jgi:hypothetical protein